MKKIIQLFTMSMLLLSFVSCGKNKTTIIEGTILETGSDRPVEDALVLIEQEYTTGSLSGVRYTIDTVYTDSEGYFKWETEEEPDRSYGIGTIGKQGYYGKDWKYTPYYQYITYLDHYNETMFIDAYAYLHLIVEDVPEIESEYCRIGGTIVLGAFDLFGENINEYYITHGNIEKTISYRLFYSDTMKIIPINVPARDTISYYIKY